MLIQQAALHVIEYGSHYRDFYFEKQNKTNKNIILKELTCVEDPVICPFWPFSFSTAATRFLTVWKTKTVQYSSAQSKVLVFTGITTGINWNCDESRLTTVTVPGNGANSHIKVSGTFYTHKERFGKYVCVLQEAAYRYLKISLINITYVACLIRTGNYLLELFRH